MASDGMGIPSQDPRNETHLTPTNQKHPPILGLDDCNSDKKVTGESAQQDNDRLIVCQFFLMGKCHFGHRCRLSHSEPSLDESEAVSPDKKDEENMEKHGKKKAKGNKSTKTSDNEEKELNKKPRMRTADDVISRILWDPSVDSSQFVVGYVDRFLGVLERPFCEFNWETNPCDCDYSSELALPRHRIQYFTYRGHRVWDRHCRTDRVFGSTGQSLAPPFGGEEEVEEDRERLTVNEDRPPAVSGQEENETETCTHMQTTHLEGEELSEMKIHTSDSAAAAASQCRGNTSQKQLESQGTCVVEEEAAKRLETSTNQMSSSQRNEADINEEGEEEIWEESWEGKQDSSCYTAALNLSPNPSAPLEQREEKRGGRPPKRRPTHFVTFRANTPAILSGFEQLQEELTSLLPSSAPHWQNVSSLHVTLCLLVLPGPAEVAAAAEILRHFAHLDRNPPVAVTFPVKLKHFNGKVLFLSPQPQLSLQQLNSGLQEAYRKEGWLHRDSYNPRYHLTLAKVEDKDGDRIFEGVGDIKVGKGLNFGRLPVNTLHLCTVGGSKVDGFFETLCSVTLR